MLLSIFFAKSTNEGNHGENEISVLFWYPIPPPQPTNSENHGKIVEGIGRKLESPTTNVFYEVDGECDGDGQVAVCGIIPPNYQPHPNQSFHFIGLWFDENDNPLDYQGLFEEKVLSLFPVEKLFESFEGEDFQVFLPTLFLAFRRYFLEEMGSPRKKAVDGHTSGMKMFVFGLDGVGKSTLVTYLKTGKFVENLLPTKHRETSTIMVDGKPVHVWDMPGQDLLRKSWQRGVEASDILLYMIDLGDPGRFELAKTELWNILNRYEVEGVPLAFVANKRDLLPRGNLITEEMIIEGFELDQIVNREWGLFFTSLKDDVGVDSVVEWVREKTRVDAPSC
ncbi:MAG: ADP-ribosylation factor-like protein [Promethearchaeota archaeon]